MFKMTAILLAANSEIVSNAKPFVFWYLGSKFLNNNLKLRDYFPFLLVNFRLSSPPEVKSEGSKPGLMAGQLMVKRLEITRP